MLCGVLKLLLSVFNFNPFVSKSLDIIYSFTGVYDYIEIPINFIKRHIDKMKKNLLFVPFASYFYFNNVMSISKFKGRSMLPNFDPERDYITVKKFNIHPLRRGDVVVFWFVLK